MVGTQRPHPATVQSARHASRANRARAASPPAATARCLASRPAPSLARMTGTTNPEGRRRTAGSPCRRGGSLAHIATPDVSGKEFRGSKPDPRATRLPTRSSDHTLDHRIAAHAEMDWQAVLSRNFGAAAVVTGLHSVVHAPDAVLERPGTELATRTYLRVSTASLSEPSPGCEYLFWRWEHGRRRRNVRRSFGPEAQQPPDRPVRSACNQTISVAEFDESTFRGPLCAFPSVRPPFCCRPSHTKVEAGANEIAFPTACDRRDCADSRQQWTDGTSTAPTCRVRPVFQAGRL